MNDHSSVQKTALIPTHIAVSEERCKGYFHSQIHEENFRKIILKSPGVTIFNIEYGLHEGNNGNCNWGVDITINGQR